jgi:hypothetical protein
VIAILFAGLLFSSQVAAAPDTRATVTIHDGLATVVARDATVAEVLDQWARAGGTAIVNGEKMSAQRVTIELIDVPEKEALDVVLRSAAAYIAIERSAASPGVSKYGKIVILATSTAPRETAPPTAAQRPVFAAPPPPVFVPPPAGVQHLIGPDGLPIADDQEGAPPPNRRAAPFGFSSGDAPPVREPAAPSQTNRPPAGVPVPGMIVAPPRPSPPQPPN